MTWIDDLARNRNMSKANAEAAGKEIIRSTIETGRKAGISDNVLVQWEKDMIQDGWIDRQDPPSDRIIEADLHVPGKTDLQDDRLAAERWPVALPWMVKEGRFFWSHGKEREALSTSIVGKFTGWRFEKGLPVVQIAWYKSEDSHCELDDLTWKALQDYHARTGNWGHVSIDWDPNDKTGHKPMIECANGECWKNHTMFGAKGASWVGDEPACPGANVLYAADVKGLEIEGEAGMRTSFGKDEPLNNSSPNVPLHDEMMQKAARARSKGRKTTAQLVDGCGFCRAFVDGFKASGKSETDALAALDKHLDGFLMTGTTPPAAEPKPETKPEAKADAPPAPEAAPAMDINALVEELAKMKGDIEELKAQMEVLGKAQAAPPPEATPPPAPAPEIKTEAKQLTTIPTVGMDPTSQGTTPPLQEKGLSTEEIAKLSLTHEGRNKLANM